MKAREFQNDLSRKGENLERLLGHDFSWPDLQGKRLFIVGMGSSYFAAAMICQRLQRAGLNAFPLLASIRDLPALGPDDRVIAISASGGSVETLALVERLDTDVIFLTNNPSAAVAERSHVVSMNSLPETGGVASLTYQATLVALLQLEEKLTGKTFLQPALEKAAIAMSTITDTLPQWRGVLADFLSGEAGTHFIAPAERLASAQQSALMVRECPRLRADASEVGDWAHIDVYLTKNHDLRLVLFGGSPWEHQVWEWATERGRQVLTIGHADSRAAGALEFPHHDDDVVAMLTETTFAEWAASDLWLQQNP